MFSSAVAPRNLSVRLAILATIAATSGLCSSDARAGVVKDAKKLLAQSADNAVDNFSSQLKARTNALTSSTIDLISQKAKNGTATTSDMHTLFAALSDFQLDARELYFASFDEMGGGLQASMSLLAGAGILQEDYPRGFRFGEMGVLDDFPRELESALEARYAKLRKKLNKLSNQLEGSGIGLCVRLENPATKRERCPSAYSQGTSFTSVPLTIDLLMTYSYLSQASDGVLRVSGSADGSSNSTLTRAFSNGANWEYDVIANSDGRWAETFSNLYERNYILWITPKEGGAGAASGIGIR